MRPFDLTMMETPKHYTREKMRSHELEQEVKQQRTELQMRASDEGLPQEVQLLRVET